MWGSNPLSTLAILHPNPRSNQFQKIFPKSLNIKTAQSSAWLYRVLHSGHVGESGLSSENFKGKGKGKRTADVLSTHLMPGVGLVDSTCLLISSL